MVNSTNGTSAYPTNNISWVEFMYPSLKSSAKDNHFDTTKKYELENLEILQLREENSILQKKIDEFSKENDKLLKAIAEQCWEELFPQ